MKVYCVFSLESPHRGDSNDYTQYTISQCKKRKSSYRSCSTGFKNAFQTAVVNKPSVFEPLKFYCTCFSVRAYLTRFWQFIGNRLGGKWQYAGTNVAIHCHSCGNSLAIHWKANDNIVALKFYGFYCQCIARSFSCQPNSICPPAFKKEGNSLVIGWKIPNAVYYHTVAILLSHVQSIATLLSD